jgi:hypothetical protein
MTFLERLDNENASGVLEAAARAVASADMKYLRASGIGRTIRWGGRTFCEIVSPPDESLLYEELIFLSAAKDRKRGSIQVGCFVGEVFRTPPTPGAELAARVIVDGHQQTMRPFSYEGA